MSEDGFVTAFAPASIGNVGVGFDMLGLALQGVGDEVSARRRSAEGVVVIEIQAPNGEPHPELSTDAERNTASIAAAAVWRAAACTDGLELIVRKGIPLQSGMGSSAASAVAAAVAANALLDSPFDKEDLLNFALEGEKYASRGSHADNVAPSLLGGLQFCPSTLLPRTVKLKAPGGISSVLLHPDLRVDTASARRSLASQYPLQQWLTQQAYLATFVLGCERGDHQLIAESLRDVIIEPQRKGAVPCFEAVKGAALNGGALGCSLSGSGPSIFALCADDIAPSVMRAMIAACDTSGIASNAWISAMNSPGAHLQ